MLNKQDKLTRILIMGAAGRDFHNFNTYFRDNPDFDVVAFTAAQIPDIDGRTYPAVLAGPRYPNGIPIEAEDDFERGQVERSGAFRVDPNPH